MNLIFDRLEFSDWLPWGDRTKAPWKNQHGAYIIANFEGDSLPVGNAGPVDEHILYIGESLRHMSARIRSYGRKSSRA